LLRHCRLPRQNLNLIMSASGVGAEFGFRGLKPHSIVALRVDQQSKSCNQQLSRAKSRYLLTNIVLAGPPRFLRPETRLGYAFDVEIIDREQTASEPPVPGKARQWRLGH